MPTPKPRTPANPFQEGAQAYKKGEYKKALNHFQKALSHQPTVEIYNNIGLCFLQLNQAAEAEKILKQGLQLNPRYVPFYDNLARLYVLQERFGEAMKLLEDGKWQTNDPGFDAKILTLKRMLFGQMLGD